MKCLICQSETKYYFSKSYTEKPLASLMDNIGAVDYYQCRECGFTLSKTHCDMDKDTWETLNFEFHNHMENRTGNEAEVNQPPYLQQALFIKILSDNGIINLDSSVDFAGGYGTMSNILKNYFDLNMLVYEPYNQSTDNNKYVNKNELGKYNTVFNSAVFEHITTREGFNEINNCVADDGCMILHTRICETVPNDPNWFYLNPPVHCAFHTNNSMEILMKQWGYKSSVYSVEARSWVLLKKEHVEVKKKVDLINEQLQLEYLHYKPGFVDYWKTGF